MRMIGEMSANLTTFRTIIAKGTVSAVGLIAMSGCIQVEAPEKPIVISLNINIQQEVVYRLDGDAKALIEEEGEIF